MSRPEPPLPDVDVTPSRGVDARALLFVWISALILVPANLQVPALGAAGTPAQLLGLLAAGWWLAVQLIRSRATLRPAQPTRTAMAIFVVAVLLSYVAATRRPIELPELNSADRGLLLVFSWWGLVLLTGDGISTRRGIDSLLRFLVGCTAAAGVLGVLQYTTHATYIDMLQIPGLSPGTGNFNGIYDRNGFARVAGTSTHPIEFGMLLAMMLPIALHFALTDTHRRKFARWAPVVVICAAMPITMSRSVFLGVTVVLVVLWPTWPTSRRVLALCAVAAGTAVVYVAIPGMLGTMTRLFTGVSDDDSAQSRTDSYDLAFGFVDQRPIFGRGFATFLPTYRILDNQLLGTLIETGVIGLAALLGVLVTATVIAARMSKRLPHATDRSLARALLATVAAAGISCATFDALSFPQIAGTLFFSVGCIAALRHHSTLARRHTTPTEVASPRPLVPNPFPGNEDVARDRAPLPTRRVIHRGEATPPTTPPIA